MTTKPTLSKTPATRFLAIKSTWRMEPTALENLRNAAAQIVRFNSLCREPKRENEGRRTTSEITKLDGVIVMACGPSNAAMQVHRGREGERVCTCLGRPYKLSNIPKGCSSSATCSLRHVRFVACYVGRATTNPSSKSPMISSKHVPTRGR